MIDRESIRFLADENLETAIVEGLRRRHGAINIQTAAEAGLLGQADHRVLIYAAEHRRLLLTHDLRTMPENIGALLAARGDSPGLLLIPQSLAIGRVVEDLVLIWEASGPEDWANLIVRLPL